MMLDRRYCDTVFGSITLNTGSAGFYHFWTEVSVAVYIPDMLPLDIYPRFLFQCEKRIVIRK